MKKLVSLLLAAASVVSLAACSKEPETESTTAAPSSNIDATTQQLPAKETTLASWPENALFENVPAIDGDIISKSEAINSEGYVHTFFVDNVDYQGLKDYVKQLEAAGFAIYRANPIDTIKTEDMLPDTLEEGTNSARWSGKRRGIYVSINWYADEYYKSNNLPESYNVSLRFYTYNVFDTTTK